MFGLHTYVCSRSEVLLLTLALQAWCECCATLSSVGTARFQTGTQARPGFFREQSGDRADVLICHQCVEFQRQEREQGRESGREAEPTGRCVTNLGPARWHCKGLHPGEALSTGPWKNQGGEAAMEEALPPNGQRPALCCIDCATLRGCSCVGVGARRSSTPEPVGKPWREVRCACVRLAHTHRQWG